MNSTQTVEAPLARGAGPAYLQISNQLALEIEANVWKVGDTLPNEKKLSDRFGVSIGTIRRAIEALESLGLVEKMQGLGTFITNKKTPNCPQSNFSESDPFRLNYPLAEQLRHEAIQKQVIRLEQGFANAEEAQALGLLEGQPVWHIEIVHLFQEQLVALESLSLSSKIFPKLNLDLLNQTGGNLYRLAAEVFKTRVGQMTDEVTVRSMDEKLASLFNKDATAPTLRVFRITRSEDNTPIEKREVWLDPSFAHYKASSGLNG